MSERSQRTATATRQKMLHRYGDLLHHKHDKNHHPYRQHCRTHPVQLRTNRLTEEKVEPHSTGLIRKMRLRRFMNKHATFQVH